jgi:hypothetical protein
VSYANRCEASAAGASVAHAGSCEPGGETVTLSGFDGFDRLTWNPIQDALAYNVYAGDCLYHTVRDNEVLLGGEPLPNRLWIFQITALFPEGEGSMGVGSDCRPRTPPAPCGCTLPALVGPCTAVIPRWYHEYRSGACEEFTWGGCGGNDNNFETEDRCEIECIATCAQPADTGDCQAAIPRWYYSPLSGHCERFVWGGCGGNDNNFESEDSCRSVCGDICSLAADPGECDGICPRWYYDSTTRRCKGFTWGCCGGNRNNFATEADCVAECS